MTDSVLYGFWKLTAVVLCENSEGLLSATNPKPIAKGSHPIACSGKPNPSKRQSLEN